MDLISQYPHAKAFSDVRADLQTDSINGIENKEFLRRRKILGANGIQESKGKSPLIIFIEQFKNPIVWLLAGAGAFSFIFEETVEGFAILAVIFVNALVGFIMEMQARSSMKALKSMDNNKAKVVREGHIFEINFEEITIGDIVLLEAGDLVPADGRLCEANLLEVEEASLTGESLPVVKDANIVLPQKLAIAEQRNMVFKGTSVTKGNAKFIVTSIGLKTELGKISTMVHEAEDTATPLDEKLEGLTKKLIVVTLIIAALFIGVGLYEKRELMQIIQTSIALAVAAIPEGLPIVATIALAYGMLRLAKKSAIVKRLSSVETLGGTNIILTDKTGTLTKNNIEAKLVITSDAVLEVDHIKENKGNYKKELQLIFKVSLLCNNASIGLRDKNVIRIGDPIELALIDFAAIYISDIDQFKKDYTRLHEIPFSSETKLMLTSHTDIIEGELVAAKGAVESILENATSVLINGEIEQLDHQKKKDILVKADTLSSEGYRLLGFAFKNKKHKEEVLTSDLVYLGMVAFIDPPRIEVAEAMRKCKEAGVKVAMVTGDHPNTAVKIGQQVGLTDGETIAITGADLDKMKDYSDERDRLLQTSVYARVTPKQKLDIVTFYQREGLITAMTGDGINDAPALKKADIGIAMGITGTQVAKETADVVLRNDSFSSIVDAIEQGRVVFKNIQRFIIYLLSCNLSEIFIVALLGFFEGGLILMPLQILFINLITDVFPALALGMVKGGSEVMRESPRNPAEPIIGNKDWRKIIAGASIITLSVFLVVLYSYYYLGMDVESCNNIAFFGLAISQLWYVFSMSSFKTAVLNNVIVRNKYIWGALILSLSALTVINYIPMMREVLSLQELSKEVWMLSTLASILPLFVMQFFGRVLKIID